MIKQILQDCNTFRPNNQKFDDISKDDNEIVLNFRNLGNWIDDEEDAYEEEDDSWREDNDNQIWAPGEYNKYNNKFIEWASKYTWFNNVKLSLETSEKNWCEFYIKIK